jgi:hypothetical protein
LIDKEHQPHPARSVQSPSQTENSWSRSLQARSHSPCTNRFAPAVPQLRDGVRTEDDQKLEQFVPMKRCNWLRNVRWQSPAPTA